MLPMASPCSTASSPCTRRLQSSLLIYKAPTSSLTHSSPKSCFPAGRKIHVTNRAATKTPTSSIKTMQIRCAKDIYIPEEFTKIFEDIEKLGPVISGKTWYPKAADHDNQKKTWYIVDATDKILGRLASTIAIHIRGKNLPTFTPSVDMGAYVIVVNAENVAVTGNKRTQKVYKRYSGRPGGLKEETFDNLQKRIPERIIEHAVRGMLPKGRLGRRLFTHLKVYKGPNHPHEAQKPVPLPITDKRIMIEKGRGAKASGTPHLGKHDREPSSASYESAPVETTWAVGAHLNLPGNLALALGFLVSSTTSSQQASLGSRVARGSSTTLQTVGVQFSTIVGTQGSASSGPIPATGGGSGGTSGSRSGGFGGSGGGGNIRGSRSSGHGPHQPQNIYMEMSLHLPEYRGIEDVTEHVHMCEILWHTKGITASECKANMGFQITLRIKVSDMIMITLKGAMIKMKGALREAVVEVEDTMVDSEAEAAMVDEVSSLMEHVIHVDPLTITCANVLRTLLVLFVERIITMKSVQNLYEHLRKKHK
ncbi:hypothetical protein KI387_012050 [Taxus chinensis]|uniref:Large ribosomal subunit protein uL13c n=1 Tax=Taxus chinensis TaxID=29808 RepID=A0AA38CI11_TAXCH|nr:hypothetical protein KI387_012050 [Taxus chinensis]